MRQNQGDLARVRLFKIILILIFYNYQFPSPKIKYLTMYCKYNYRKIGKIGWSTFLHKSAAHMRKSGSKNVCIMGVCTVHVNVWVVSYSEILHMLY